MASLERLLHIAVQKENLEDVKTLIKKGANVNDYSFGLTPVSLAAKYGNIQLLDLLIHFNEYSTRDISIGNSTVSGPNESMKISKRGAKNGNNGYYIVFHDESGSSGSSNNEMAGITNDATTPEGMEKLEWDIEVQDDPVDVNDVWSAQYRWYADILEKTCHSYDYKYHKCEINLQDSIGRSAMHYCSEQGHLAAVKLLIEAGGKVDIGDVDCLTPLHLAASRGHASVVELLLRNGANVNRKTTDKMSPLHYASSRDFPDVVELLLNYNANIDCLDSTDRTPLKLAASRNLLEVAIVLLNRGAKVNIEDNKGYTALCEAVWKKSVELTSVLLDAGAKIKPDNFLLHYAVMHRHEAMVSLLLEAGAMVNLKDSLGQTPLITAVTTEQISVVKLLLKYGAMVDYYWEITPLSAYISSTRGANLEMIQLLLEHGADMNRTDHHDAPLARAIVSGKTCVAALLIAMGADVNACFSHPTYGGADAMFLATHFAFRLPTSHLLFATILLAGYDLKNAHCLKGDKQTSDWLKEHQNKPLQLAELTRIAIRRSCPSKSLLAFIKTLPIPSPIKHYLLMLDLPLLPSSLVTYDKV